VERQPAHGLRGIDVGQAAVMGGGRGQGLEPTGNEAPVGRLHRAYRDQVYARADRLYEAGQRHGLHAYSAIGVREQGEEYGGEVLLGGQHARAVGESARHEPGERRDLIADGHPLGRGAHEAGESLAGPVDQRVISGRLGAARPPCFDGFVESLDAAPGRQPDARGVDVDASGLKFLLRRFQTHQINLLIDAIAMVASARGESCQGTPEGSTGATSRP